MRRANVGAGSVTPEGWTNFDITSPRPDLRWDVLFPPPPEHVGVYGYAVCSFMLNEIDHHHLVPAVENMRALLKPGGTLRILVPDLVEMFYAYQNRDEAWFPQDDRTGRLDAKFCTMVTWYGTVRSVFTPNYLVSVMIAAGLSAVSCCRFSETFLGPPEIVELDSREPEALIVEGRA